MGEKKKKTKLPPLEMQFNLRMTNKDKELLELAATAEGLPLGTWMRVLALKAAREILAA